MKGLTFKDSMITAFDRKLQDYNLDAIDMTISMFYKNGKFLFNIFNKKEPIKNEKTSCYEFTFKDIVGVNKNLTIKTMLGAMGETFDSFVLGKVSKILDSHEMSLESTEAYFIKEYMNNNKIVLLDKERRIKKEVSFDEF